MCWSGEKREAWVVPWGVLSAAGPACDSPVGILLFLAPGVVASGSTTVPQTRQGWQPPSGLRYHSLHPRAGHLPLYSLIPSPGWSPARCVAQAKIWPGRWGCFRVWAESPGKPGHSRVHRTPRPKCAQVWPKALRHGRAEMRESLKEQLPTRRRLPQKAKDVESPLPLTSASSAARALSYPTN